MCSCGIFLQGTVYEDAGVSPSWTQKDSLMQKGNVDVRYSVLLGVNQYFHIRVCRLKAVYIFKYILLSYQTGNILPSASSCE